MSNTHRGPSAGARRISITAPQQQLLDVLQDAAAGLTLSELARACGVHENTVRGHLEHLVAQGLVGRDRKATGGRGQPPWVYVFLGDPASTEGEMTSLAVTLARAVTQTADDPIASAIEAGQEWGRRLAEQSPDRDLPPAQVVAATLRRMGFAPHLEENDILRLTRCPLLEAAKAERGVVCAVHLGMARGLYEGISGRELPARSFDLESFAESGSCLLHLPRSEVSGADDW